MQVKSAKGRKLSSTLWLERQLNDPYVARAKRRGYRGRAAFKILELDDKYRFLVPGARVVDLGCAPGGWCQVAVGRVNALGEKWARRSGACWASTCKRSIRSPGPRSISWISRSPCRDGRTPAQSPGPRRRAKRQPIACRRSSGTF